MSAYTPFNPPLKHGWGGWKAFGWLGNQPESWVKFAVFRKADPEAMKEFEALLQRWGGHTSLLLNLLCC